MLDCGLTADKYFEMSMQTLYELIEYTCDIKQKLKRDEQAFMASLFGKELKENEVIECIDGFDAFGG